MLCLTRKKAQSVVIHKDGEILCEVFLNNIRDGKASLGFKAGEEYSVDRREIYDDKQKV